MKNMILSVAVISLLCVSTTVSYARDLGKGTIEISGDFDLSVDSVDLKPEGFDKITTDTTTLSVDALYYVAPNIGVGLTLTHESVEEKSGADKDKTTIKIIGPAVSYNISLNDKTSLKLQGAIANVSIDLDDTTTIDGFGWNIGAKVSYFLNEFVSLDAGLDYLSASLEENGSPSIDVDLTGFSTGVGISVYVK